MSLPACVVDRAVAVVLGRLPVRAEGGMDLNEDEACVCQCLSRCVVAVLAMVACTQRNCPAERGLCVMLHRASQAPWMGFPLKVYVGNN